MSDSNGNGKISIATIAVVASMITVAGMLFAGQMATRERLATLETAVSAQGETLREIKSDIREHMKIGQIRE